MPALIVFPAAARPYPGEVPVPVHEAGIGVAAPGLRPAPGIPVGVGTTALAAEAGPGGCTGQTKAGTLCKGRAGDDGLCAAHKDTAG